MNGNETLPERTCEGMAEPTANPQYNARVHLLRALTCAKRAAILQDLALVRQWMQEAQKWLDQLES